VSKSITKVTSRYPCYRSYSVEVVDSENDPISVPRSDKRYEENTILQGGDALEYRLEQVFSGIKSCDFDLLDVKTVGKYVIIISGFEELVEDDIITDEELAERQK
jgi:hypothetical protein